MKKFLHPLMSNNFEKDDLDSVIKLLKTKDPILTQSKNVLKFEKSWSKWLGVKYSVFVSYYYFLTCASGTNRRN